MKSIVYLILFFAFPSICLSGETPNKGYPELPFAYTPIDSLQKYYQPLIRKKEDLSSLENRVSEEKIAELFTELKSSIRVELNEDVISYIHHYSSGQRKNFEIALSLFNFYQSDISTAFSESGLPNEFQLLPIVLSGVHNQAVSPEGGVGIWRLNYYVALRYGLTMNSYYDERKDPVKSTEVAIRYLKDLHKKYKSWNLAVTAFSFSPAMVNQAILRSGGAKNYWEVRPHLRQDAKNLIPSFFATTYLHNFFIEHDLNPPGILLSKNKEVLTNTEPVNFEVLSKELNINEQSLRLLNPTFRGSLVPIAETSGFKFYIPIGANEKILAFEEKIYEETKKKEEPKKAVSTYTYSAPVIPDNKKKLVYEVKSGDYLGKIAESYHVGVSQVRRWNNMRSDRIDIGQKLTIYVDKSFQEKTVKATTPVRKASKDYSSATLVTYKVKNGDTLWGISKSHPGNTIEDIQQINNISDSIKPGQVIKLIKSQ